MDLLTAIHKNSVITVSERPVRIYSTEGGGTHPIHGAYYVGEYDLAALESSNPEVTKTDMGWIICCWTATGKRFEKWSSGLDLKLNNEATVSKE